MVTSKLTLTALAGIPLVKPGDDLVALLIAGFARSGLEPADQDVVVVAQKIVSKAEGRFVDLRSVVPSERSRAIAEEVNKDARLVDVILSESDEIIRKRRDVLITVHRLGLIMANAGVDQSNVAGESSEQALLLPRDPDGSAAALKAGLDRHYGVDLAVIINDSFSRPWRHGVVGVAIGAAGIPVVRNMVGTPDLYGRKMRVTEIALADEIATAASLLMGQADEGQPAVHLRGLSWDEPPAAASKLLRPKEMDLFR